METTGTLEQFLIACVFIIVGVGAYMLPGIIAFGREHRNAAAISVLNFCLGWTFLGWIAALVWSFTDNVQ